MRKAYLVGVVLVVIVSLGILLEVRVLINATEETNERINTAIDRGFAYLDSKWDGEGLQDEYLEYVYPGENLDCPNLTTPRINESGEGMRACNLTYRKLDSYFDLKMLEDVRGSERIRTETEFAERVLDSLVPEWRRQPIYNTIKTNGTGMALDTYCILGLLYSDREMARKVREHLTGTNLMDDNYYSVDAWRNIADETWCIRLFSKTGVDKNVTGLMAREKIKEADSFLTGSNSNTDKAAVLIHMVPLLEETDLGGSNESKMFKRKLLNLSRDPEVFRSTLLITNILEVLSISGVSKPDLGFMEREIIERQGMDGGWRAVEEETSGEVFTTFRAILALDAFRRVE